jgi:hypothetical protein
MKAGVDTLGGNQTGTGMGCTISKETATAWSEADPAIEELGGSTPIDAPGLSAATRSVEEQAYDVSKYGSPRIRTDLSTDAGTLEETCGEQECIEWSVDLGTWLESMIIPPTIIGSMHDEGSNEISEQRWGLTFGWRVKNGKIDSSNTTSCDM